MQGQHRAVSPCEFKYQDFWYFVPPMLSLFTGLTLFLLIWASRTLRRSGSRRPTNERYDVRSAGVADWKTARRGNTERTLTAAAPPPPRDPYRHALTMRPPQKVRPFSFLNYLGGLTLLSH